MAPIVTSLASIVKQFGIGAIIAAPSGGGTITYTGASGGVISDYTYPGPGTVYRAHIFTSSGTFSVTDAQLTSIEYLVVAGGGGGGNGHPGPGSFSMGCGGAGGLRTASAFPISSSPGLYSIIVGSGGAQ